MACWCSPMTRPPGSRTPSDAGLHPTRVHAGNGPHVRVLLGRMPATGPGLRPACGHGPGPEQGRGCRYWSRLGCQAAGAHSPRVAIPAPTCREGLGILPNPPEEGFMHTTENDLLDLEIPPPAGGQILHQTNRATILWGDCHDPNLIAQVPDGYGLLCTDPPYGIGHRSNWAGRPTIAGDDGSIDWLSVLGEWAAPNGSHTRGLANSRHVYIFGYDHQDVAKPLRCGATTGLIWDKALMSQGDLAATWSTTHEPIAFGIHRKRPSDRATGRGQLAARFRKGSVLRYQRPNGNTRHPHEKPVPLLADLIESSTIRGDLVVDPCAGSGTTGVAAVLEGRRCFLVEYKREFAELCVQRVQAAERLADQMTAV
ncbi:site-specific DNA-methyltransferase [Streptomyces sp. SHP22-7]|nr:site-specific DNA-methyltransferase [Streptomyces sp. SHP22-7]RIH58639.1 site-specific DNA-methyltransferase [Streptomyces sp. SHP22-7]